jgi:hypothetical protein
MDAIAEILARLPFDTRTGGRTMLSRVGLAAAVVVMWTVSSLAADASKLRASLKEGSPQIQSAGPIAFGPEGILFVGDAQSAAIFAIDTGDTAGSASRGGVNVEGINQKVAALLGTDAGDVTINDLAVNPASGNVYLSVSRGRGPDAAPVLLRVGQGGKLTEVSLENVQFAKANLPNPPATGENQRRESITDLAYVDGRVFVAGLSNEEFASKLRSIPFPFRKADEGTSVEIFHGAHGRFETKSPVRTFVSFEVEGKPHLLAAYTCTPLVKFPVSDLKPGQKIKGTTVAELGNRNRPLDMIVYRQGDKSYLLMANTSRGMMKIPTEGIDEIEGIEEKIDGKAGLNYETIAGMEGVVQLDRLNDEQAVVIIQKQDGTQHLETVDLP